MALHVDDSVVVKSGVHDPDFGIDISGWQGRIEEFNGDTVFIRWDSITLQEMGLDSSRALKISSMLKSISSF